MPSDVLPPVRARRARPALVAAAGLTALAVPLAGCHRKPAETTVATPVVKARPTISEIDLKSYKPNEAGAVMILMYHDVLASRPNGDLNRTPESFRKDLNDLYTRGYRPVTVSDFVENKMDVPPGKSPVVLTFDDARLSQFNIIRGSDGNPHIDPDCAVGIMETFSKAHPDWKTRATFFVLPKEGPNGDPFGQTETVADKFAYLTKNGYEIANHTSTHKGLRGASAQTVQWELATAVKDIKAVSPDAKMQVLALPYGYVPHKDATKYLFNGESGGTKYHNIAVLRAAWRPVASPITLGAPKRMIPYQIAPYEPGRIERMTPNPDPKKGQTYEYWLKYFDENPGQRYVSDGNPEVVAVPKSLTKLVNANVVAKEGKILQLYTFGGSGGGGLSVEASAAGASGGNGLSVAPAPAAAGSAKGESLGVESTAKR